MNSHALQQVEAVVIGTSAGGVEALGILLPGLTSTCLAAVLVVVHLPRERPSLLKHLYTSRCALPINEAEDKQPVEPGNIYFAPPDYHLLVDSHADTGVSMTLSVDEPVHFSRPSIDVLFEAAADCWGPRLMGVILTGANEDGARGLGAVARAGGITVVQEPQEAFAATMPTAALRTGLAQHVLPLDGIRKLFSNIGSGS